MKKALIMSVLCATIMISSSVSKVYAKDWGISLPQYCISKSEGNWDYRHDGVQARISLTQIVGGPSYYVRAWGVNSNGQDRSTVALCKQGGGFVNVTPKGMMEGYEYYVQAKNDYFESECRWAYGEFEW